MKLSKLDIVFSKLVRERAGWRCEKCGTYYPEGKRMGLHCSHLWSRSKRSTRWHPLNAFAHCFSCHQRLGGNPVDFHEWALAQLGDRAFTDLRQLANQTVKRSKPELEDLYREMKVQLAHMEAERARGVTGRIEFTLEV